MILISLVFLREKTWGGHILEMVGLELFSGLLRIGLYFYEQFLTT